MSDEVNRRASQDLFEDSLPLEESQNEVDTVNENAEWKGVELSCLKLSRYELIPNVIPSAFHCVTFRLPVENGKCPLPHPKQYQDVWDNQHVRLPCSSRNQISVSEEKRVAAWPLIKERLNSNISSSRDLQQAIISYAWKKGLHRWNFIALHKFFSETLSEPEAEYFFESVLPGIVDQALSLDSELTCAIQLLRKQKSFNISITQRQASCLLANAFLCTFPDRNFAKESYPYPSFNFTRLFLQGGELPQEKLKCFINYFRRACTLDLDGVISFSRRSINPTNFPSWLSSNKQFTMLHITSEGTIDNDGQGMLQIDFANKFVGGGVLGYGCVQEEITFLLCPELIVSRLFTEYLDDTEALIITGAEKFNTHTGYSNSFKWAGAYDDSTTPRDSYKRKCRTIVALDALKFNNRTAQYKPEAIFREINKAYCGFSFGSDVKDKISIATGNWGCGAFRGDPKLKALIQLTAAAQCNRNLVYFTFYDVELRNSIFDMYSFLVSNNITVGQLCCALSNYHAYTMKFGDIPLYDYLVSALLDLDRVADLMSTEMNENNDAGSSSIEKTTEQPLTKSNEDLSSQNDICVDESMDSDSNQNETIIEDISMELPLPTNEPMSAETYSLKTEEGRKRCIKSEKERWKAYESAIALNQRSQDTRNAPVKKKISDYFQKTPKKS